MSTSSSNKGTPTETSKPADWFKGIGILLFVGWVAYYFVKEDSSEVSQRSDYSIVETSLNASRGFNITVRIQNKMEDLQLIAIAKNVKEISNTISDEGLVFFLLPEMVNGNGSWASVNFTPDPVVNILGLSIADEMAMRASIDHIKDYVGLWINNYTPGQVIIRIRKDKKYKLVSEFISPSETQPSKLASPIRFEKRDGQPVFREIESTAGDYYLFKANGDLDCYDNQGYIQTYKLLKMNNAEKQIK